MAHPNRYFAALLVLLTVSASAQTPTIKTNVDQVVLDLVVRDKKGKPINDLKREELTVTENGAKQTLLSFRHVQGSEAISSTAATASAGAPAKLDALRQLRLVTLAFEPLGGPDERKLARTAALDLVKSEQGPNVFYSVVAINTRLLVLQAFTTDRTALAAAIDKATAGTSAPKMVQESDSIQAELKRQLGGDAVGPDSNILAAAAQAGDQPAGPGADVTKAALAQIMLDILRMDQQAVSSGTRLSLQALKQMVQGLASLPGRKSVLFFTGGMYLGPELDTMFDNLVGLANRANVTFYSVDSRGVGMASNAGAAAQLNNAARASATTMMRTSGGASKNEIMAADNAESAGRANTQLRVRELAESTGGFLIGDSNDLRAPVHKVAEEIASYYEVTFNPGITNYDGSFRKLGASVARKDAVVQARTGYFAFPPTMGRAPELEPFEVPLFKTISDGKLSTDVEFAAGAVPLQAGAGGSSVSLLVEVPLKSLQTKVETGTPPMSVHCSLASLVKDEKGEVVRKLSRDRSLRLTAEQAKAGNFIEKTTFQLPAGKYTLETAVMDRESGKTGFRRSEFTIVATQSGLAVSQPVLVRSYTPAVKDLDPAEVFQFQGGSITPTLGHTVVASQGAALRLFFTVYPNRAIKADAGVEAEFTQGGKSLAKVPLPLPPADAQGKIPYVMTIPAASIPPGTYLVKVTAKQGAETAGTAFEVNIAGQ